MLHPFDKLGCFLCAWTYLRVTLLEIFHSYFFVKLLFEQKINKQTYTGGLCKEPNVFEERKGKINHSEH